MARGKKARQIIHRGHDNLDRIKVAEEVIDIMNLKLNEAKLLRFYATTNSGDNPTVKAIQAATGIPDIHDPRQRLAEKKIITETDREIIINWKFLSDTEKLKEQEAKKRAELEETDRSINGSELKTKILIHIRHTGIDRLEVAKKVAKFKHLRRSAKALLEYYAMLPSGSMPTERLFTAKTGFSDMVAPRKNLEKRRVILVYEDAIIINWRNLWALTYDG